MRSKYAIAIVSTDFRLVYIVQSAIKDYFNYKHLGFDDDLSLTNIVISTRHEFPKINHNNIIIIESDYSPNHIRSLIVKHLRKNNDENSCIVGIDPGKTIGAAIIYLGEITNTSIFYTIEELIYWIKLQLIVITYDKLIMKIGNGDKASFDPIFKRVEAEFSKYGDIRPTNEFRTSIKGNGSRSIHEEAAIRIARRD